MHPDKEKMTPKAFHRSLKLPLPLQAQSARAFQGRMVSREGPRLPVESSGLLPTATSRFHSLHSSAALLGHPSYGSSRCRCDSGCHIRRYKLQALAVSTWCDLCRHADCMSCGVMATTTQISKDASERLRAWAGNCCRVGAATETLQCSNTQWSCGSKLFLRPPNYRATRVQCQPGKAAGMELQCVRAEVGATPSKSMWVELPEILGAHPLFQCFWKVGHGVKEGYSQALGLMLFAWLSFRFTWNLLLLSSFLLLPFGMELSIVGLSHHCILEIHNLFHLTHSQLERNLPQD